jgi:hypothetical protein
MKTWNDWPWRFEFEAEGTALPNDFDPYYVRARILAGSEYSYTFTLRVFYEGVEVFGLTNDKDADALFKVIMIDDKFPLEKLLEEANKKVETNYPTPVVGDEFDYQVRPLGAGGPAVCTYRMKITKADPENFKFEMEAVSVTRDIKVNL